jgi:hypothetical protein
MAGQPTSSQLSQSLQKSYTQVRSPPLAETTDYHDRYIEAAEGLAHPLQVNP